MQIQVSWPISDLFSVPFVLTEENYSNQVFILSTRACPL